MTIDKKAPESHEKREACAHGSMSGKSAAINSRSFADASATDLLACEIPAPPEMVRVAPGVHAWSPASPGCVPRTGVHVWSRRGDGSYVPTPVRARWVIVTREVLDAIGFRGIRRRVSDTTLRRLARAEEVVMVHISPKVRMLDLDSWERYITECALNPDKWEEGSEAWENYMFRNALGRHRP